MLKDKLQRKGSQINVAPKWHEFVKEWDRFLEEPPSLLFSASSEACLGAARGCLLQCKQPDTSGFSTSWDLRGLWGQSRVMHVACAACPHRQGCAFAPWSPPASSLVPNPSPTAHPRWGLLGELEETEATKSSLLMVLLPRWAQQSADKLPFAFCSPIFWTFPSPTCWVCSRRWSQPWDSHWQGLGKWKQRK